VHHNWRLAAAGQQERRCQETGKNGREATCKSKKSLLIKRIKVLHCQSPQFYRFILKIPQAAVRYY
jgi:malate synthase